MEERDTIIIKMKKGLSSIPKILSWAISILGLYFSYISLDSKALNLESYIIVSIILGNSIFLIIFSFYEGMLYKNYNSKVVRVEAGYNQQKEKIEEI